MFFGERIAECRKSLNWSQEALADRCSVTRQAVAKWEKGESMPDIYTIARLANLFSITMEELIKTTDAVVETQDFYIRRLQENDKKAFCELMYELGVLGRTYIELNKYKEDDGTPMGEASIIKHWYPYAEHIYLLIRRTDQQALGVFNLCGVPKGMNEISVYIRQGFEMDMTIFKDFFVWVRNEYQVRAATLSVWHSQEEDLLSALGYQPNDGICSVAIPLD